MNLDAVNTTLAELERMGRIETVDAALVAAARSIATALDENPHNAQLWKAYRETLEGLTGGDGDGDDLADLLAELGSPPVGDTPTT